MALRLGRRRIARPARIALWSIAAVVAIVVVGAGVFLATFDANSLKPRIIAAVKQATGRDLTLQGDIRLGVSLQPTLQVSGVSFSNPPGFSRPQMATLERLDLKLALLPLLSHRVEIDKLVLVKPDILLEANAQGQPNWQFTPEPGAASGGSGGGGGDKTQTRITVADLRVLDGVVTLRTVGGAQNTVLAVKSLEATAPSPDANLHVAGEAAYNGAPFTLTADVGPLTRLQETGAGVAAWPVRLTMAAAGAKLTVDGSLKDPLQGSGYDLKVAATVPDLAALSVFTPGRALPPLHDVAIAVQLADAGAGKLPQISGLTLHVGASDLGPLVAGLKVGKLDIAAARLDQPVQVSGQGSFGDAPAVLSGSVGAPDALLSSAQSAAPAPIDLSLQAAGSSLTVKGTLASGAGQRVALKADVKADTIDLDKLRGLFARPAGGPVPPAASAPVAPAAPAAASAPTAPASPAAPPVAKAAARGGLFPDTPIPFDVLRVGDADVTLAIATLKSGSVVYRSIGMHAVLAGGKLAVDPYSADLPEGHLDGSLSADASQAAPPVALKLHAPALALAPLLAALGEPGYASGNLEVYADLRGAGTTPHAIAAGLDGSLGLAMVNGTVDNRVLGSSLEAVLREINLFDLVGRGGTSQIQCFAMRLDAAKGIATFRTLVLASSLLSMDGGGSVNLAAESLDMRVRAQARVVGTGVVVPLHVRGPLRSPSAATDAAAAVLDNAGTVVGLLSGATPLSMIAGVLTGQKLQGGGEAADCGPALAVARGQAAPVRQAGSTAPASPPAQQKPPNAGALLKQLFR
jgi:AsmA protein